ncbi:uncharacterized protein LY79DRAFT_297619 [Colletotrichum navitas]|uniref:Uncharacterized protein n=1 Tax=Colletotrichum navitas TaxID=681940 RepID=A0AAD8PTQ1_9PEZI|nr:uncharacterized protein LY79DRAFT_297619 [Colletotrichum navitas]KAK1580576.1 hypothetical protein LY79DRAFT_297619 [Colletotrichum navitas]
MPRRTGKSKQKRNARPNYDAMTPYSPPPGRSSLGTYSPSFCSAPSQARALVHDRPVPPSAWKEPAPLPPTISARLQISAPSLAQAQKLRHNTSLERTSSQTMVQANPTFPAPHSAHSPINSEASLLSSIGNWSSSSSTSTPY